jgi:hypothetical protein
MSMDRSKRIGREEKRKKGKIWKGKGREAKGIVGVGSGDEGMIDQLMFMCERWDDGRRRQGRGRGRGRWNDRQKKPPTSVIGTEKTGVDGAETGQEVRSINHSKGGVV